MNRSESKKLYYRDSQRLIKALKLNPKDYAPWIGSTADYWEGVSNELGILMAQKQERKDRKDKQRDKQRIKAFNEYKQILKYTTKRLKEGVSASDRPASYWKSKKEEAINKVNLVLLAEKKGPQAALDFMTNNRKYITNNESFTEKLNAVFNKLIAINSGKKDNKFILETKFNNDREKHFMTITPKNMDIVVNNFSTQFSVNDFESIDGVWVVDSNGVTDYEPVSNVKSITLRELTADNVIDNRDGAFFPYINTTNLDLTRYQVYNQEQAKNRELVEERDHCLIHALRLNDVDESKLNSIKLAYKASQSISKKNLKEIASLIGRDIIVHTYSGKGLNLYKYKYSAKPETIPTKDGIIKPPKGGETNSNDVLLAMFENHYFIYDENTKYSKYSIDNYNEVKDIKDFERINAKRCDKKGNITGYKRSDKQKINSLLMLYYLKRDGHFKKQDMSIFHETAKMTKPNDEIYLEAIEEEQQLLKVKSKSPTTNRIYYADCESFVNKKGEKHELYMIGYAADSRINANKHDIVTIDAISSNGYEPQAAVNSFLSCITNYGKEDAICFFHNLKYDWHLLEPYMDIITRCEKGGLYYSITVTYKNRKIELRDSYKLVSKPLRDFPKTFNLPKGYHKKEAIAYTYYTKENHNVRIKAKEYSKYLSNKDKELFKELVKKDPTYDKKDKTFNPSEYYRNYLKYDCLVLKEGLKVFNQTIKTITREVNPNHELSIYDFLTISSLTDHFMKVNGAYDGVYEVCGNLRDYIAKAVYGGRVHVNEKYVKQELEGKLVALDGVSLYPSAIQRLCREKGLPIGKCKRIKQSNLNKWREYTYAILSIKINKVNKIQQMPILAHRSTVDKSTTYSNDKPEGIIIVDTITLEDYIKLHEIEYEIVDGIYWNEGVNTTMGKLINELFQSRLKYKKQNNDAMSSTIKLMLNSSYGKTIMKKTFIKKVYKSNVKYVKNKDGSTSKINTHEFDNFVCSNYNTIDSIRQIGDKYEIQQLVADYSFNRGHIGCLILSYSKRIMNEIFDTANDLDIPIYYTDTDSMHLDQENVNSLIQEYNNRYNKQLEGKLLEQFHGDLSISHNGVSYDAYAKKSIFLGKKSYIDVLEAVDNEGNLLSHEHVRMKGITEAGLNEMAKKYGSHYNYFKELAKGKELEIILNPYNQEENVEKVMFKYSGGTVCTRETFKRKVKF